MEEFIRWVTPIHNMCRTATTDTELGGQTIRKGQQVVMMYPAANRDPDHFHDPETYDVTRSPNNHIAFGFGTHFCLGAALAPSRSRSSSSAFWSGWPASSRIEGAPQVEMPNAFVHGLREAHLAFIPA